MAATSRAKKTAASREPQTRATGASVPAFLARASSGPRLADAKALVKMMRAATGKKPVMWGPAIVGFGSYLIPYADGREAPWPVIAFSPRKSAFVLYVGRKHADLVKNLGKCKMAGGCLYIKA